MSVVENKPMPFAAIPEGLYCRKLLGKISIDEIFFGVKEVKVQICPYEVVGDENRYCSFLKEELENGLKSCQINVGMEG